MTMWRHCTSWSPAVPQLGVAWTEALRPVSTTAPSLPRRPPAATELEWAAVPDNKPREPQNDHDDRDAGRYIDFHREGKAALAFLPRNCSIYVIYAREELCSLECGLMGAH